MLCDICNREIKSEEGYKLTTSQVVLSSGYWKRVYQLVESGTTGISLEQFEPLLPMQIQKMSGARTDWLVCEECMGFLDSSFIERRKHFPNRDWRNVDLKGMADKSATITVHSGSADMVRAAEVAFHVWETKYGKKPAVSDLALLQAIKDQESIRSRTERPAPEMEQLIREISSGSMTIEQLEELLEKVNSQLARYKEALTVIEKTGTDNWTYEVYAESLRIGGDGEAKPIERQRWEQMFTKHRLELRTSAINYIDEGQRNFERIKTEVETELGRQRQKSSSATQKKWWQFWK